MYVEKFLLLRSSDQIFVFSLLIYACYICDKLGNIKIHKHIYIVMVIKCCLRYGDINLSITRIFGLRMFSLPRKFKINILQLLIRMYHIDITNRLNKLLCAVFGNVRLNH